MTTTETGITTAEGVLAAVRRLGPSIADRAGETEAARRVPRDLLDALIAARVFRMLRPPSHGGLGADLSAAMRVYEELARADASVGWVAMIGSGSWCDLAALPRRAFDDLFSGAPDLITAGVFAPAGTIAADGDGYRVTGRWSFASGSEHADWIYGNCVEAVVDGVPRLRIAVFSPDQVVIEDTWRVAGLSGTGSHHFHVDDLVVPADRTLAPMADPPSLDAPIVRVPPPALLALAIASVAMGVARGALDDILSLAAGRVPLLHAQTLSTDPTFHRELAAADTELGAARALIHEMARAAWEAAGSASGFTPPLRARVRAAAVWATWHAADVVRAAYRAGGGGALYSVSPLQRRLRDIDALTQHFLVRGDTLTSAGAILAGQDPGVMVF